MSFDRRMCCLRELKDIGFRIGCGFVVGSPYQTPHMLAKELKFIEELQPDMCDIIPFVPHKIRRFPHSLRDPCCRQRICFLWFG